MASSGDRSDGPDCPSCGREMMARTARRGRNAGDQFWGCVAYPTCKGTRAFEDMPDAGAQPKRPAAGGQSGGEDPPGPDLIPQGGPPDLRAQRVHWPDWTLRRTGWRAFYATVGGSLRSVPDRRAADLANCWVAREERRDRVPVDDGARLVVVDTVQKVLSRGVSPPMHPDAERALLARVGLGGQVAAPGVRGDVAPRLKRAPKLPATDFLVPTSGAPAFESGLTDSDEEWQFVEWVADRSPEAVRWLLPQFPLGSLVEAAGSLDADGGAVQANPPGLQRCDFLFAPVGTPPVVIEIDGGQHAEQVAVDDDRDSRLEAVGVPTIRVPTSELAAGKGPGLRAVEKLVAGVPAAPEVAPPLVWGPIQVHRLVLALCEAIAGGFVSGDQWLVEVRDPTGIAVELVGPYLELLAALDRLRGSGVVAPLTASFVDGDRVGHVPANRRWPL